MRKKRMLINWFCLLGVFQLLFYLLHDVIGALNYPGYNWLNQAVSDLTSADAPSRFIAGSLSNIYALFSVLSMSMLSIIIQENKVRAIRIGIHLFTLMIWISAIGYTLFPLSKSGYAGTFQDIMHLYVITILVVLLSIISLVFIIVGGFKSQGKDKYLAITACLALIMMFVGAIGSGVLAGKKGFGILERFSTYSAVVFGSILSIYGFNVSVGKKDLVKP
ncbi:MAG: DUF998 domain-containing protein [Bacilli bacterium]|jgi:hypothetical membrane protein